MPERFGYGIIYRQTGEAEGSHPVCAAPPNLRVLVWIGRLGEWWTCMGHLVADRDRWTIPPNP